MKKKIIFIVAKDMENLIELIKTGKNSLLEEKLTENPSLAAFKTEQGISLLQFAAYCRNQFAVALLKKHITKLDIFEVSSVGDAETVGQLLNEKPELLNSFSPDGFTVLGLASFFGHLSLVKLLLDKGANPNIPSNNFFKVAPLHSACAISSISIAELLLAHGADVNAKQMQGVTPLHSAAHYGQTELTKLLIDKGADINVKMDNGQTPLSMANEKGFHETTALIRSHGGN
ncbi:MAG TPA: ankyrin repeat domain-containing protein [Cyclobacteriaceae bacterium]